MSQQQVTITITAKDGASQTFQAVGRAATGMSSTAQAAAAKTSGSLRDVATQAGATEKAVGGIGRGFDLVTGAAAGLVGSAVVGFLGDSARAAAESEVAMGRLSAAVEAAGGNMATLGPSIERATSAAQALAFDDEAAAAALATLTQQTGDANQAINLLGLTMDIARGRGVDLSTAADAVGKAAAGNTGALQRMGVVLEDGATAQDALAAAQQKYAGQAENYAGTTQAAFDRLNTTFGNFQESVGAALGPAQTIVGLLPGMSSGFSMVTGAIGAVQGAGGFGGLLTMVNPLALGLIAVAGATAMATLKFAEAIGTVKDYTTAVSELSDVAYKFADPALAQGLQGWAISLEEAASAYPLAAVGGQNFGKSITEYNREIGESIQVVGEMGGSLYDLSDLLGAVDRDLHSNIGTVNDASSGFNALQTILQDTGPAGKQARDTLNLLNSELEAGTIRLPEWNSEVNRLAYEFLPKWTDQAAASAAAQRGITSSIVGTRNEFDSYVRASNDRVSADEYAARKAQEAADAEAAAAADRADAAKRASSEIIDAAQRSADEQTARIEETRSTVLDAARQQADEQVAAAEHAEKLVIDAAENQADRQIAAAEATEKAVIAAAERAADAQVRAATQAARDATREINVQMRAAERAADLAYNKATGAAQRNEQSAKDSAEREYDARVQAANDAADREIDAIRRKYEGGTEDRLVREAEARRDAIIRAAEDERAARERAAAAERVRIEREAERQMLTTKREAERAATQATREENRKVVAEERQTAKTVQQARETAEAATAAKVQSINAALEAAKSAAAQDTAAVQTAAAQRVARVEERTAARIQAVALETARVQAAASAAAADAAEESAARRYAAETGQTYSGSAKGPDPLDGPVTRGGAAKGLVADTSSFDATMSSVNQTITKFEQTPVTAKVKADKSLFDATIAALNGATVATVSVTVNAKTNTGQKYQLVAAALGRTIRSGDVWETSRAMPAAASGRTVLVGEAGPELAYLPYGTQVMPSTPSMSKLATAAAGGGSGPRFYGPVYFNLGSADVAAEVQRQLATRSRG